jgi:hypothetical protein
MKRLSILAILLVLLVPAIALSVGTGTYTTSYNTVWDNNSDFAKNKVLTVSIKDDTHGTTVALVETDVLGYFLCSMETDSGTTAPTDDYDIVINTAGGVDILGGAGANRDTANTETAYPTIDSTTGQKACVPVNSALSLVLSGNDVNNATVAIKLMLVRP